MEELISIIVPVYNVEKYVSKCIESILNQTYTNIELILVDDGSKDKSGQICDEYANKDNRITVIHKQNEGVSKTRNRGLEIAKGSYISFIDSDDYVENNFIEELYYLIKENNTQIAQCGFASFEENKKEEKEVQEGETTKIYTGKQMIADIYTVLWIPNTVVWNKLYKAELVKKIKFKENVIYEDEFFSWKIFYAVDKIAVTEKKLYNYRKVAGSITNQKYTIERLSHIEALEERLEIFKRDQEKELYDKTLNTYLVALTENYNNCKKYIPDSKNIQKELKSKFKKNWKKAIGSKSISSLEKFLILNAVISKRLYGISAQILANLYKIKYKINQKRRW